MNSSDAIIRDLEIMANAVNYRGWIYGQFSKYLGQRIVELGAGIGNFTEFFLDREIVIAVDNYELCIEYLKNRFSRHKNIIPLKMDISSPKMLELDYFNPDTIVCINVLEHVQNDVVALSYMFKILQKGGRLLLLVPAIQFLYGSIDRLVGHYRRYDKKDLRVKLISAGFGIREVSFMNSIGVLGWFLNNRVFKRSEESTGQVIFYDKFIVPWLKSIESIISPPFGLSLLAIGEKEDD